MNIDFFNVGNISSNLSSIEKGGMENLFELQKFNNLLLEIFDKANIGILIIVENKIRFINQKAITDSGYTKDELLQVKFSDFLAEDEKEKIIDIHQKRLNKELDSDAYELKLVHKDGSIIWVENKGVEIEWEGKKGSVHYLVNTTKSKESEIALRKSEEKLRKIVDLFPLPVAIASANKFEFLNPGFSQTFGYELEEVKYLDQWFEKAYPDPNYRKEVAGEWFNDVVNLKDDSIIQKEFKVCCKDNSSKMIKFFIQSFGECQYLLIAQDITEAYNSKKNLEISEEKFKILNESKDKFFSIIAHDLKSPFNTIIGFSNLLLDEEEEFEEDEFLEIAGVINSTSKETYNLLINLLDWSRSEAGSIIFKPKNHQLFEMAEENVKLLKSNANRKAIDIINNIDPEIHVFADKNMVNTILRNLISNAIKFTNEKGKVSLSSSVEGDMVNICVSDNGIGITKERINKVFDFNLNKSTFGTNKERGTGLGLLLCHEFTERNGGGIWVESEVGKGSTFCFTLPNKKD